MVQLVVIQISPTLDTEVALSPRSVAARPPLYPHPQDQCKDDNIKLKIFLSNFPPSLMIKYGLPCNSKTWIYGDCFNRTYFRSARVKYGSRTYT